MSLHMLKNAMYELTGILDWMQVDIGCEQRTVVSECKYVMDVEDAVGKKVLFVANVPPTEVCGIMSHGEYTLS